MDNYYVYEVKLPTMSSQLERQILTSVFQYLTFQKRAMKLKLQKEKEERNKVEAHEKQLELERQLTAKVAGSEH